MSPLSLAKTSNQSKPSSEPILKSPAALLDQLILIVLDNMSAKSDTYIVVSLWESVLETMRMDFILQVATVQAVENSDCGFTDDYVEMRRKNRGAMTNDNIKLAQSNRLHIAEGEVQRDEAWYDPRMTSNTTMGRVMETGIPPYMMAKLSSRARRYSNNFDLVL